MLSLLLSLLTVSGKDHWWAASPLQSQIRRQNIFMAGPWAQHQFLSIHFIRKWRSSLKCSHLPLYGKATHSEKLQNNTQNEDAELSGHPFPHFPEWVMLSLPHESPFHGKLEGMVCTLQITGDHWGPYLFTLPGNDCALGMGTRLFPNQHSHLPALEMQCLACLRDVLGAF